MATVEDKVEVRAQARWVRTTPRKAELVAAEIRGRSVPEARVILAFMTRAAARDVSKALESAIANAEANHGLFGDDLYVLGAEVGTGPTLKRWRARARGRVGRIRKRTCHITIRLAPVEEASQEPLARAAREERRGRSRAARPRQAAAAPVAPPEASEVEAPAEAEGETPAGIEAPADIEAPAEAEAPAAEEKTAEEAPAEEKPKRRTTRSPKAASGAATKAAEADDKPKPTRSRKRATPPSEDSATEEKPKRTRTRKPAQEDE